MKNFLEAKVAQAKRISAKRLPPNILQAFNQLSVRIAALAKLPILPYNS